MNLKSQGFSTVDIMLWIVIVGVIASVMFPGFKLINKRFKTFQTERILDKIELGLTQYSLENGSVPRRHDGGLNALFVRPASGSNSQSWNGPYTDAKANPDEYGNVEVLDGWGRAIEYNNPPVHFKDRFKSYELISVGQNEEETQGYIARGR